MDGDDRPTDAEVGRLQYQGHLHARRAAVCTYDPATPVCGHVAVYWQLLAQLPIEEDGVDSTQSVSVHQMLGTVLRMREYSAPCARKEAISRKDPFSHYVREPLGPQKVSKDLMVGIFSRVVRNPQWIQAGWARSSASFCIPRLHLTLDS